MTSMIFIDPNGPITVRSESGETKLYQPGDWRDGEWQPTDLADLPTDARAAAAEHWTSALVSSFQTASQPVIPTAQEVRKAEMPDLNPDQFWFGLRVAGYEDDVRAFVASLNDPGTPEEPNPDYDPVAWASASAKLEFATYFERDHPLVHAAKAAIGIGEVELDTLWKYAAGL